MLSALTTLALLLPSAQRPFSMPDEVLAIRAKTLVTGEGAPIEDGVLLIQGGKIRSIGRSVEIPAGAAVVEHDGVVTAGMVALHDYAGTRMPVRRSFDFNIFGPSQVIGYFPTDLLPILAHAEEGGIEVEEPVQHASPPEPLGPWEVPEFFAGPVTRDPSSDSTRPVLPDAELVHAFDPTSPDFAHALEAGVTSIVLTPSPRGLIPGQTAVVKTASGRILQERAHLSVGLGEGAFSASQDPTSFGGALVELEGLFAEPKGVVADAAAGRLPVMFEVQSRQDVLRAIGFARTHHLRGVLNGASWAGEVADAIRDAQLSVVCGPFPLGVDSRSLRSVLELARAKVPFGFGIDVPFYDADMIRLGAAACVRQGLDRTVAWNALTGTAARIAGVEDRVGRLARGMDADVVLWSGDPLDLSSRVQAVLIDGAVVYREPR